MANQEKCSDLVAPEYIASSQIGCVRVVLPAYNEEASLPLLLNEIVTVLTETKIAGDILVVNDGSLDRTADVACSYSERISHVRLNLLDLQPNRGLAGAVRAGLSAILSSSSDQDIIVIMDADNTHPPGLIPRMVQSIREGAEVVIASRYREGSAIRGVSAYRKVLSLGASWLMRIVIRIPGARDYTCGYRAYRAGLLRRAKERWGDDLIQQVGFGCMAELLIKLKPLDPVICEVPLILRYDRKQGDSKMRVVRTIGQTMILLGKSIARRA